MKYGIIESSEIELSALSFWQSRVWSEIILSSGQARDSFYYGNKSSTFLHIEIRSVGLGFFGAFSLGVSALQVSTDWDYCISQLQIFLRNKGILFLQIEPIENTSIESLSPKNRIYKKFLTPHTRILDLNSTEDSILSQMHEKGRYNIRLAIKRGVHIEKTQFSEENLDIWMGLLDDTLSRDGFAGNSRKYYENFIRGIEKSNQGGLYFARFEDRVIAAGIFVFTSNCAIYYYGASSSNQEDRKQMAPYLLQWQAICEAQIRNIPIYDFLGVADPGNSSDSLKGVTDFKEKFGGQLCILPNKILFSLTWKYKIFYLIYSLKNFLSIHISIPYCTNHKSH